MKFLNGVALVLFMSSALFLSGCDSSEKTATPPTEVESPETTPAEELILPADSLGEGSEPKNSGPFGGAVQPEEAPEE